MNVFVSTANKGTLNMRAAPNQSATVLARIPCGTIISVDNINDEWVKTTFNDVDGYVMSKFLSTENSTITKSQIRKIYDNLKQTLKTIEEVLN